MATLKDMRAQKAQKSEELAKIFLQIKKKKLKREMMS